MELFKASSKPSIRLHTILIGASPLIPIPFLDVLLAQYLMRHMVSDIAKGHKKSISPAQIRQLADAQEGGGFFSVLASGIALFIKEVIRDLLFWLEWKRGIDLATEAYHFGYLVDRVVSREDFDPVKAPIYRRAIKDSLQGFQTTRFREGIRRTFSSSRAILRELRNWLVQFGKYYVRRMASQLREASRRLFARFRRRNTTASAEGKDNGDELDNFLRNEQQLPPKMAGLMESLSQNLEAETGKMPGYFEHLSNRLDQRLEFYADPQNAARFLALRSQQSSTGIAAFVASLLALLTVPLIVAAFYGQRYWDSALLRTVAAWMPCLTALMIMMGAGTGFISLSEKGNRNTFGILAMLLSGLTFFACCLIFALVVVFNSNGGR